MVSKERIAEESKLMRNEQRYCDSCGVRIATIPTILSIGRTTFDLCNTCADFKVDHFRGRAKKVRDGRPDVAEEEPLEI